MHGAGRIFSHVPTHKLLMADIAALGFLFSFYFFFLQTERTTILGDSEQKREGGSSVSKQEKKDRKKEDRQEGHFRNTSAFVTLSRCVAESKNMHNDYHSLLH
jgi:hypothetical protein